MTLRFPTRLKHLLSAAHLALGAIFLTTAVPVAQAQSGYPTKPIRVIVPFAAGGVADITIRIVAEKLGDNLGQRLVIENMPGAGGVVAARAVLSSQPDGYTLALLSNGTAVSVPLFKNLPFDPVKNFAPISSIGFFDFIVGTNANSQHKTLADVIKFARDNPGKLNVGTISVGSTQNLSAELLKSTAGINFQIVPYRGTPEVIVGLLREDIDVMIDNYVGMKSALQDGKMRPVGTTGESRSVILKDVPTMIEGGVRGYDVVSWNALFAPSGTPPEAIARLNAGLREVLAMPDVKQKLLDLGIEAKASSPEELKARLVDDIAKWTAVIDKAGIPKQ
ncbi:Bug family tripartite tricarboxylate transporter substrate binding protein [Tardiphaga robiniae]|uniref:Tripartite tricarboxylate transporter receptor protein n=1 Tax=Tardiphaga robiniae TaxID=943830 RepID=A0A164AGC1_9BRAD|nr:tripartite tricarboxylate transporter substrate binding protein [Tardiphaga robiniae]KZD24766.1 tripartite tricarboxylate transporter receptor protein [Tardiphaga robiniae]